MSTRVESDRAFDGRKQSAQISSRIVIAAWTVPALLSTFETVMFARLAGRSIEPWRAFLSEAPGWYAWAALTPLIAQLATRVPLSRPLRWRAVALHAACYLMVAMSGSAVWATVGLVLRPGPAGFVASFRNWFVSGLPFTVLVYAAVVGIVHSLNDRARLRIRERDAARLAQQLSEAQLASLRMQLQPHFLFNALHTVSSLMVSDVPTAQRVVSALGDLLRSSLDHTAGQEIRLRDELAFVQRYVDIQQARFRHRLLIDVDVPDTLGEALVPSLVLQSLVENAIRHGIEPSAEGGRIWIRATRRGGEVALTVENEGIPNDSTSNGNGSRGRGGVGLANLEARLAQLYGSAHAFRADWNGDGRFTVTLRVPYHTDASLFPVPENAGAME